MWPLFSITRLCGNTYCRVNARTFKEQLRPQHGVQDLIDPLPGFVLSLLSTTLKSGYSAGPAEMINYLRNPAFTECRSSG